MGGSLDAEAEAAAPLLHRNQHSIHFEPALLGEYDHGVRRAWHPESTSWQVLHALAFVIGGTTFLAGTALLFIPEAWADTLSALLYVIGSCGFLFVDVQEFLTFDGAVLRTNIAMSMTGSVLYVVGSVGYYPPILAWNPRMGIWGFVLGSAFIAWSQLWKTRRIGGGETDDGFSFSTFLTADTATAAGVELSAGVGALCFFFGTLLYDNGPLEGPGSVMGVVLWIWVVGSIWFTLGGLFLAARHFAMRVV